MIDVFIPVRPSDRRDWLDECVESIKGQGVTLYIVEDDAPFPRKFASGLLMGKQEWIGFVDCDDVVMPNAFNALRRSIALRPDLALHFTGEHRIGDVENGGPHPFPLGKRVTLDDIQDAPQAAHHLCVMRRDVVIRALRLLGDLPEQGTVWAVVALVATLGGFKQVFVDGYGWRIHEGQTWRGYTPEGLKSSWAAVLNAQVKALGR